MSKRIVLAVASFAVMCGSVSAQPGPRNEPPAASTCAVQYRMTLNMDIGPDYQWCKRTQTMWDRWTGEETCEQKRDEAVRNALYDYRVCLGEANPRGAVQPNLIDRLMHALVVPVEAAQRPGGTPGPREKAVPRETCEAAMNQEIGLAEFAYFYGYISAEQRDARVQRARAQWAVCISG